jgi:PX domain-containing protein kinase-like protein
VTKKHGYPFKEPVIRLYGRQILEAAKFLHSLGLPVTHLHTGNIFVEDNVCRLSDFENAVLGIPCLYHHQLIAFGKCSSPEEVAVVLFGMAFYEMSQGKEYSLTATSKPTFSSDTPKDLQKVSSFFLSFFLSSFSLLEV